jgi:Tol biopolymer transport system component
MKGPALLAVLVVAGSPGCAGSQAAGGRGIVFIQDNTPGTTAIYRWQPGAGPTLIGPSTRVVESAQWSPDGALIAFTARDPGSEDASSLDIYVMHADGSGVRQLTNDSSLPGVFREESPSWSPDGSQIVYYRILENSPYYSLFRVSLRTGAEKSLHAAGNSPVWGKPGIAYMRNGTGPIMLLNPTTGRSRVFVSSSDVLAPFVWSSRGDLAVMQGSFGSTEVATYSAGGRELTHFRLALPYSPVCGATWSPDGRRLLLTVKGLVTIRNRLYHGHRPPVDKYAGLWTTTPAGKDPRRLLRFQPEGSCQTSWR